MLDMIQEMDLDIVDFRVVKDENDRIDVYTKHMVEVYEAELNLFDESSGGRKIFCVYGKNSSLIRNRYV